MILLVALLIFIFLLSYIFLKHMQKRKGLPPGPIRWPVVGNLINLALLDPKYPHLALTKMAKTYGDVLSIGFGVHEAVVISSYEAMKSIMTRDEAIGRFPFPVAFDRAFHQLLGIIWSEKKIWRDLRRYSSKSLRDFGFGKSDSMDMILCEEMDSLVELIKSRAAKDNGVFTSDHRLFAGSAVNILWQLVAGHRFEHGDEMFGKLLEYSQSMMEILGPGNIYNPLPFLRHWFPKLTNFHEHQRIHKQAQDLMKEIIDETKKKRAIRGEDSKPNNFIEAFIDEINKNRGNGVNEVYTERQLMLVLMDLFLGGSDTTGTMLNWIILHLTLNPKVQQRIQDEIDDHVGPNGSLSIRILEEMPYIRAALLEMLRISPMGPIPPPREIVTDFHYQGYRIPKGTVLMMNLYPMLMETEFWEDPEVFRPERFLEAGGTKLVSKYAERVYAIFGFGKRMCFGDTLAKDTLIVAVGKLMQAFTFEAIPGQEPSTKEPTVSITLIPRKYKIRIISRNC